jgi:hypothetical protein
MIVEGNVGIGTNAPSALLDVNGTAIIGSTGSVLNGIIKATSSTSSLTIAANTTSTQLYPVSNSAAGASVLVSPASALNNGIVIAYARVSSAGFVEVSYRNTTAGSLTLTSGISLFITVIQ